MVKASDENAPSDLKTLEHRIILGTRDFDSEPVSRRLEGGASERYLHTHVCAAALLARMEGRNTWRACP